MAIDGAAQQALDGGQFPAPTNKIRLSPPDGVTPVPHAQQPLGSHGLDGTFDLNKLSLTESHGAINQPRCRWAQHHPAVRRHRLHPLGYADLLTDSGVAERA